MSHGDKYTGREIEQAAKKILVHRGISGAIRSSGFEIQITSDVEHSRVPLVAFFPPVSPRKPS